MRMIVVLWGWVMMMPGKSQEATFPSEELIEWNEFYELSWDDFKGKRTVGAIGDAGTHVMIKAQPHVSGNKLYYTVHAFFNKQKSWVSDSSDALLRHEQLHFDIAELYARKVRKKIREMGDLKAGDIKACNALIREILEESNETDQDYDIETLHGSLLKKQRLWEEKVQKELAELSQFKKEKWVIGE